MSKRIIHVFYDQDMRCRHDGLWARALKEREFKREDLRPGDVLCFINSKQDRLMAIAGLDETDSYGVLGYYRSPHGKIDETAIQYIPQAFNGSTLEMNKAIKKALTKKLGLVEVAA